MHMFIIGADENSDGQDEKMGVLARELALDVDQFRYHRLEHVVVHNDPACLDAYGTCFETMKGYGLEIEEPVLHKGDLDNLLPSLPGEGTVLVILPDNQMEKFTKMIRQAPYNTCPPTGQYSFIAYWRSMLTAA